MSLINKFKGYIERKKLDNAISLEKQTRNLEAEAIRSREINKKLDRQEKAIREIERMKQRKKKTGILGQLSRIKQRASELKKMREARGNNPFNVEYKNPFK